MIFKKLIKKFARYSVTYVNQNNFIKCRFYHNVSGEDIPAITLAEIKESLKLSGTPFIEGHACIIANCPICTDNQKCKVYVNKITGFFVCENCTRLGQWSTLDLFLQSKKTKKNLEQLNVARETMEKLLDYKNEWNKLKLKCKLIGDLSKERCSDLLDRLNIESLDQDALSEIDVLYENETKSLYFPLMAFLNIHVGYIRYNANAVPKESTFPSLNACGILINKHKSVKADSSAVLVNSIEDFLALVSNKAANLVLCLPHGLKNIPQQILPSLESYNKLILWFGNDDFSWDTARHFAKKLNDRRCVFVRPMERQPRPKTALKLKYDLKEIIKNAQPIWHKSITTFHSLRQDVLSELQNVSKVQGVKWKRYPTLNKILKGHRKGEFTVLTGPTGSGKTTFMSDYSLDLVMQGVNTLWGSFEIRNARLAKTMLQQMVEAPLEENVQKFDEYADIFEKLPIYFMTFHGQQSIKVVMEAVEHATYVHDIAHVIIDNVQFMLGMSEEPKFMDRFWKQDKVIGCFRQFATKFNCHVTLVIHPRKEKEDSELTASSIFGGAKASQEADNILIIQDKRLTSIRGKKFLQVAKNRYSGDLGIMPLDFDKNSLSYAQKKNNIAN